MSINSSKEWCNNVFDKFYWEIFDPACSEVKDKESSLTVTQEEVNGIIDLLGLKHGDKILDMACGYGRHCKAFAEKGLNVTGVDLSDHMIRIAEKEYYHSNIKYVNGDMKDVKLNKTFDACVNLYISFGFFKNHDGNIKVLKNIARHLKPRGKFLLETVNPFNAVSKERLAGDREQEGHNNRHAIIKKTIDPRTMWENYNLRVIDKTSGREIKNVNAGYYLYTIPDIARMGEEAGLKLKEFYGCDYHVFERGPYDFNATRIISIDERQLEIPPDDN